MRINQTEQKLRRKGIVARLDSLRRFKNPAYAPHIDAMLDFVGRMVEIFDGLIEVVDAEPMTSCSGDIDLYMRIKGRAYSFQIKARNIVEAYAEEWVKGDRWLNEHVLNDFGIFARLVKWEDRFWVLEKRRVSVDDYSIAAVFEPTFRFKKRELNRMRKNVDKGSHQLKDSYGYKILVYDARHVPIPTEFLIVEAERLLKKYDVLSGIILIRLGMERYSRNVISCLISVPNYNSGRPLNRTFCKRLNYGQLDIKLSEPRWLLSLPIMIDVKEAGWQYLLDVRPGYRVFREGVYMGSITPPKG